MYLTNRLSCSCVDESVDSSAMRDQYGDFLTPCTTAGFTNCWCRSWVRLVIVCRPAGILEKTTELGSANLANSRNAEQLEKGILCFPKMNASLYGARMFSSSKLSADCKIVMLVFYLAFIKMH